MQAPKFSDVAADIRAEKEYAADSERHFVRLLTDDIERFDPRTPIGSEAKCAVIWIYRSNPSDADVTAIVCALFGELARHSHIERNRSAMAALRDIAEAFAGSHEADETDCTTDQIQDARRDERNEK